jgi:hypothetical protein
LVHHVVLLVVSNSSSTTTAVGKQQHPSGALGFGGLGQGAEDLPVDVELLKAGGV